MVMESLGRRASMAHGLKVRLKKHGIGRGEGRGEGKDGEEKGEI